MSSETPLVALRDPFPAEQMLWRVVRSGITEGSPWVRVVPYIHARTIQERLDDVLGVDGWQVKYRDAPGGHVICALGVRADGGHWIWKEDGTGQMEASKHFTAADAGKGDFSNAFKRAAASGYGIGRYIGYIPDEFAELTVNGRFRSEVKGHGWVNWDPPELPEWALPEGTGRPDDWATVDPATGEIEDEGEHADAKATIRKLRNKALRADLLTDPQVERVDQALASSAEEPLQSTIGWLEEKLEKAGIG